MAQSLIGCEAVRGARSLRFEDRVLQPAPAAAAPCIAAVCQERGEGEEKGKEDGGHASAAAASV